MPVHMLTTVTGRVCSPNSFFFSSKMGTNLLAQYAAGDPSDKAESVKVAFSGDESTCVTLRGDSECGRVWWDPLAASDFGAWETSLSYPPGSESKASALAMTKPEQERLFKTTWNLELTGLRPNNCDLMEVGMRRVYHS